MTSMMGGTGRIRLRPRRGPTKAELRRFAADLLRSKEQAEKRAEASAQRTLSLQDQQVRVQKEAQRAAANHPWARVKAFLTRKII